MRFGERGSVAVVVLAVVVIGGMLAVFVGRLGALAVARARAETAADAAALGAADELALGRGAVAAERVARTIARANGAVLDRCRCPVGSASNDALVTVTVRTNHREVVTATARAHIQGALPRFAGQERERPAPNHRLRKETARKFRTVPAS